MKLAATAALWLGLACACTLPARAGTAAVLPAAQVRIGDLVRDLQRVEAASDSIELVWWMPREYMEVALAQNRGALDAQTAGQILDLFERYTVVAAVRGRIGALGMDGYASEAELRDALSIHDAAGQRYAPIPADQVDSKLVLLISFIRPMFKQMVGELGDNMQIFVFPNTAKDGRRIASPKDSGQLTIQLGDHPHRFRLPLGSLMAPRRDRTTGETFPGSYNFNPYTGSALETAAP